MKLGLIYRPQFAPEQLPTFALAAEAGGMDELWLWEDCFANGGISAAAAALAFTSRIGVGIGVLPVPLRNVALTAMEVSTLARMFPSRLHAGVGHGVLDWMGQVGARASSPMTLLREYVVALRALLDGTTVEKSGEYVELRGVTLDWPPSPAPPLYVGAGRPKTLALSAELTDGTILTSSRSVSDVADARGVLDAAGAGKRLTVFTSVGADADETVSRVGEWAAAGADAVILEPAGDADPARFVRFVVDEVRPQVS